MKRAVFAFLLHLCALKIRFSNQKRIAPETIAKPKVNFISILTTAEL